MVTLALGVFNSDPYLLCLTFNLPFALFFTGYLLIRTRVVRGWLIRKLEVVTLALRVFRSYPYLLCLTFNLPFALHHTQRQGQGCQTCYQRTKRRNESTKGHLCEECSATLAMRWYTAPSGKAKAWCQTCSQPTVQGLTRAFHGWGERE
jgi:hypothetical protein